MYCDLWIIGTWGHPSPLRQADILNNFKQIHTYINLFLSLLQVVPIIRFCKTLPMRLMVAGQKATQLRANTTAQATRKPKVVIPQVDLVNDLALSHKHMWHFFGVYFRKFKSEVMKWGINSTNVQSFILRLFIIKKTPKQCNQFKEALKMDVQ